MNTNKTKYSVIHEHEYGADHYIVRSNHFPSDEEVIKALGLDFEEDEGETLTLAVLDDISIKDIPDLPEPEWNGMD